MDDKRGYIDRAGKVVIEPRFEGASNFSEGLAVVTTRDNGYAQGYIEETGKIVIKPQFDTASAFSEGLAAVGFDLSKREFKLGDRTYYTSSTHPAYKWGFIDRAGKYVVEPQFSDTRGFSEGLAAVRSPEGKFGFIDRAGRAVIPPQFKWASSFSEGLACVMVGDKYGYIDKAGRSVIKPRFTDAGDFSEGLAAVRVGGETTHLTGMSFGPPGGRWRHIDKTGQTVIRHGKKVVRAGTFSEGRALVEVKGGEGSLYGYIDRSGYTVIEPQFSGGDDFSDGLALVWREGKQVYIDKFGTILIESEFPLSKSFHDGLASVQVGGFSAEDISNARYGYIDKAGNVVWTPSR